MLKEFSIKNLSVFPNAQLTFSPGLNVIIGENGCGKSHLLKVAYAVISASAEGGKNKPTTDKPQKLVLQKAWAEKLVHVLRPKSLGRLARRRQGRKRCELGFRFDNQDLDCRFDFATSSKSEVQIEQLPSAWHPDAPVFLSTRELLTLYPNFVSVYENHYLEFEETYRDTCVLLGALALRGPREKQIAKLLAPLEEAMGGKVVLDKNGRFYLHIPRQGTMEISLVAEGLRKLGMLARLISTGSLFDKGYLFWDEPETNLNPKLIKLVAKAILELCRHGIQVFVATHSLFLLREFEVLSQGKEFKGVGQRYFALKPTEKGVQVEQGDDVEELQTLLLLDEELAQSDRYMDAGA
ncbi:AAA family ATPase [Candidatus Thiosymbion oneisti]|uniref:AAA family ATPase n=1 Tax=Candidatus Thiosymbion oneisti TaxID=589554 RepID=UPI000A728B77|nr:ATP-binding protein [Candidatus Thiosymbion oneisti]